MRFDVAPAVVTAGVGDRLVGAEPFQFNTARLAAAQKVENAILAQIARQELKRAGDISFFGRPLRQSHARHVAQRAFHGPVAGVPALPVGVEQRELGPQNGRTQIIHSTAAIRCIETDVHIDARLRSSAVAVIQHVGARQDRRPRHQLGVAGDQEAALARIDVLVGLRTVAGGDTVQSALGVPPRRTHRMGAVLDHNYAVRIGDTHQRIHIGEVPAHMGEQQDARFARLDFAPQILKVDDQFGGDFNEHRLTASRVNGAGYGRQRESVG